MTTLGFDVLFTTNKLKDRWWLNLEEITDIHLKVNSFFHFTTGKTKFSDRLGCGKMEKVE